MGVVYAIGSNGSGQLGIGHKEDVSVPKEVNFTPSAILSTTSKVKVAAGGNHTLLLSSGEIHCSGDPSSGACGLVSGSDYSESRFQKIRLSEDLDRSRILFCAATWEASIIVQEDENGRATKVYSFGIGNKGELAQGELLFRSSKAQLVKDFPPEGSEIVDLTASVTHVVAVLDNGAVYGWGNGRKGQLGQPEGIIYSPKIIDVDFKVLRTVCGREFTYLVGEPEKGEHAILGSDKWSVRSSAPPAVPRWKDVGASWGSIFVLQEDGNLLSWGREDHGQLAPPALPSISQIGVGSEHVLGLTVDGDVLAWGWGEHGNCGPITTNGDVKGRWNVIASSKYLPPGTKISGVGAGCATSWIFISD
ncbi:RCC1 repeat-containing protein [Lachnellula willkommii]|uniref:RCC1 repeat-containing protein n=1 Tax=Lachnellula willkommii TaxID=215461 RepID=A0A559MLB9_9HELO|nr:RCC1 repeat-containing protein [Lachnellula willkommii]